MKFSENPYYNPEKCGLSIFESIDTAGSYEFDIFCIWEKNDDRTLWYDTDSGCSCPTPFDDHGNQLEPITEETFYNFDQDLSNHSMISADDYKRISKKVKDHLKSNEHDKS